MAIVIYFLDFIFKLIETSFPNEIALTLFEKILESFEEDNM